MHVRNRYAGKRGQSGFSLVEILLVASLIALLTVIAVPAVLKARIQAQKKLCLHNLRLMEDAIEQVMVKSNYVSTASIVSSMLDEYLEAETVADLNWPAEVSPPSDEVIQQSETFGLYVMFDGERLRLNR